MQVIKRILCLLMLTLCLTSLAACAIDHEPEFAAPGAVWVPGHDQGWRWVPGHWA